MRRRCLRNCLWYNSVMSQETKIEYEKALDLFGEGKFKKSAEALLRIVESQPDFADAYEALARVYYRLNSLDQAIEWAEKLAILRPDNAMAHTNLSVFYMKKGMKERAEEEKAKAVVLNFENFRK